MSLKKDLKVILRNQSGVALMMVMTAIILLMAIYGEFTFESKISRLKATNVMDRSQAKLLAESGLQMAMARLRLYKEAFNKLESNTTAKSQVPPQLLNQLWEVPFIFPIPIGEGANSTAKDTVQKFTEDSLLEGGMRVTVSNISNRMNLNMLRFNTAEKSAPGNENNEQNNGILDTNPSAITSDVSIEQTLYFLLKRLVDEKKEKDPSFENRYGNINYQVLVTNLKYYMSDYQSLLSDPLAGEAEATFQRVPMTPKYGPMSSASELFAIPGWDDELIELIQNEFSVYPAVQIDLNKLTANMLRILIPNISDDQIRDFFEYRDDPENPKFFNTDADFKKWAVEVGRVISVADFTARMDKFKAAKITFGSNPNLFKVISEGLINRSVYTLVAYVYMPKQEAAPTPPPPAGTPPRTAEETEEQYQKRINPNAAAQTTQLLEPRIIEMQIN